jgi:probable F420-dependent oxidoreductase
MRFIFTYPDCHGADGHLLDAGPVPALAAAAEAAGWHGMAFTEHPAPTARWLAAGGHQTLDPFVALGAAAAVTDELRLLTYLAVLPYRNPLLVAKAAATVDQLSGGRFVLGAGAGYLKSEFLAVGADFDRRNALLDEALDVMARSWNGQPFDHAGLGFDARDVQVLPAPPQQPIPVWLGGNARRTLERVATKAQGWLPLLGSPSLARTTRTAHVGSLDDLADRVALLRDLAGDRFGSLDIAVPMAGGDPTRDAEGQRDTLGRMAELGATWVIVVTAARPQPAAAEFIEAFAATHIRG